MVLVVKAENVWRVVGSDPQSERDNPLPHHTPSPGPGRKRPSVGTQTLVPLNFSAVVALLAVKEI